MSIRTAPLQANLRRRTTPLAALRSEGGALDLASIMVGVLVIGAFAGIVAATVFAVIPWAQDRAAEQNLDSVATAEGAARVYDGTYFAYDSHPDSLYRAFEVSDVGIQRPTERLIIETSECSSSWVAAQRSATGNIFVRIGGESKSCDGTPAPGDGTSSGPETFPIDIGDPENVTLPPELVDELPGGIGEGIVEEIIDDIISGGPRDFGQPNKPGFGPGLGAPGASADICADPNAVWAIADPDAAAQVRSALNKDASDPLLVSDAAALTQVDFYGEEIDSIDGIQCAVNAEYVWVYGTSVTDVAPLAGLVSATEVSVSANTRLTELSGLAGLPMLERLALDGNGFKSLEISGAGRYPALRELNVEGNPSLMHLQISDMPELKELRAASDNDVLETVVLSNLPSIDAGETFESPNLRTVDVTDVSFASGSFGVHKAQELESMTLERVSVNVYITMRDNESIGSVSFTDVVTDGVFLSRNGSIDSVFFTNLTVGFQVDLNNNEEIGNVTMSNVDSTSVNVNENQQLGRVEMDATDAAAVSASDNGAFRDFNITDSPTVKSLYLSGNQIGLLNGVGVLPGLEELYIADNYVLELGFFARLPNLKILDVSGNPALRDIEGVENLQDLRVLKLQDTDVSSIAPVASLNLYTIYFWNTSVTNMAPLFGHTNLDIGEYNRGGYVAVSDGINEVQKSHIKVLYPNVTVS